MTVSLGLVCSDGVLVASDSMGSNGGVAVHTQKVFAFDRSPAIWTAAGTQYVMEEVHAQFEILDASGTGDAPMAIFTKPDPQNVRKKLNSTINATLRSSYANALGVGPATAGGQVALPFYSSFLVLGYANDTPWFLEFDGTGQINWHTEPGFYSIGSGGEFATVASGLMSHYFTSELDLHAGLMLAYRTIETTVKVSSSSVGLPVQIAVCDANGTRVLNESELEAVAVEVARWKEIEKDSLFQTAESASASAANDLPTFDE